MHFTSILAVLVAGSADLAACVPAPIVAQRSDLEPYQPYSVSCPAGNLVRPAATINPHEASYIRKRRPLADAALRKWLQKTWDSKVDVSSCELPAVALSLGGGGPKAGLLAAGVLQALDSRDSSSDVSGLLQSMTYMSALSGGSLTLDGVLANNFGKISTLRTTLWDTTYQNVLAVPLANVAQIVADLAAKVASGLPTTVIDVYGRFLGYDFVGTPEGANGVTMSSIASTSAFTSGELPYPVIQATNADVSRGELFPNSTDPLWEFGPYEFGSWNKEVGAFVPSKYLGSKLTAGRTTNGSCETDFDNLGFITGISSNIIAQNPGNMTSNSTSALEAEFLQILAAADPLLEVADSTTFGVIPNPFYKYPKSTAVNKDTYLYMLDGGDTGEGMPIWPWIQSQRQIDVIITSDHSSDASNNDTTDGSSLYATYAEAQREGLTRMPLVPTTAQIAAQNLTSHARFFGCNQKEAATLIWLPDVNTTAYSSSQLNFTPAQIEDLVTLGNDMSTQTNATNWPTCLACGIMKKKLSHLPASCSACFAKYCWTG